MADLNRVRFRRRRYFSHFGEGRIEGEDVIAILPFTYMNLSGKAVAAVMKDKNIPPSDILIVCDDADLDLGNIRIRPFGSDGGHRGLRSIIAEIGTSSFNRLRIGIGRAKNAPPQRAGGCGGASSGENNSLKDYVLKPFSKDEKNIVKKVEKRAAEAIHYWLKNGINKAMNRYNASFLLP